MEINKRIDDYANSMFQFENLHHTWVRRCAKYLSHVFGDKIKGRTVVDYAFGRGNWSLAFLEAGASRVVSIDAARSNVAKFSSYLKNNNIIGIDVLEGNILENTIDVKADILWIYGILPCISEQEQFLSKLTNLWAGDEGIGLLYAYNSSSLRQVVINLARMALKYETYDAFQDDSFLFNNHARMRVRDDLTAPSVYWHSKLDLWRLVIESGGVPSVFVPSFQEFENLGNKEFMPHHLLFNSKGSCQGKFPESDKLSIDDESIWRFGKQVFDSVDKIQGKKLAIGLVNTHFSALASDGYEGAIVEDFLYLFYAFNLLGLSPNDKAQEELFLQAQDSLKGFAVKGLPRAYDQSVIANYLANNIIRI